MPPVANLQKWARRKLGLSEKEAKQAGWAIAKAIARDGTVGKPYLAPAFYEMGFF